MLVGPKFYFHVNSSRKNSVVLILNMANLSRCGRLLKVVKGCFGIPRNSGNCCVASYSIIVRAL